MIVAARARYKLIIAFEGPGAFSLGWVTKRKRTYGCPACTVDPLERVTRVSRVHVAMGVLALAGEFGLVMLIRKKLVFCLACPVAFEYDVRSGGVRDGVLAMK